MKIEHPLLFWIGVANVIFGAVLHGALELGIGFACIATSFTFKEEEQ